MFQAKPTGKHTINQKKTCKLNIWWQTLLWCDRIVTAGLVTCGSAIFSFFFNISLIFFRIKLIEQVRWERGRGCVSDWTVWIENCIWFITYAMNFSLSATRSSWLKSRIYWSGVVSLAFACTWQLLFINFT